MKLPVSHHSSFTHYSSFALTSLLDMPSLAHVLEVWAIMRRSLRKDVDFGTRKLTSRNLLLEQKIELGESSASGFRDSEVGIDDAKTADAAPEETSIIAPIPGSFVEHIR